MAGAENDFQLSPYDPRKSGSDMLGLAFSPDGRRLLAYNYQDGLNGWELATGRSTLRSPLFSDQQSISSAEPLAMPVAVHAHRLVYWPPTGEGEIWDLDQGKRLSSFPMPTDRVVIAGALAPRTWTAATVEEDGRIDIWTLPEGHRHELGRHEGSVFSLDFHPAGELLASAGEDGQVRIWQLREPREVQLLDLGEEVTGVCFSPDGEVLVAATKLGTIALWRTVDWQLIKKVQSHQGIVVALAFSPDGQILATGGADALVQVWERHGWVPSLKLKASPQPLVALAFSPDSRILAAGDLGGSIRLWRASLTP